MNLPRGTQVPNHIAIILDGNGRWARAKGLPVTKGHEYGAKALREVMNAARDIGVHTVTIWGFSTENWKRPPKERAKIFALIAKYLKSELNTAQKDGLRLIHLGRKDRLPKILVQLIEKVEKETRNNNKYILNVALDYGGQNEIVRAVKKIVADKVPPEKINEELFANYLDTHDQPYPYPDLFIRTSGELRTSGLLPWQMAYTEFYFEEDHLPDMTAEHLEKAILDYSRRRRRYGGKDKIKHFKFKPEMVAKFELAWWRLENIPSEVRFRDYAISHLKEQFGLSKQLAVEAAGYMGQAILLGQQNKWGKAKSSLRKFYQLVKEEFQLAFEPSIVASLDVKLTKEMQAKSSKQESAEAENTAKELYAEVYRISLLQAAKLAHLRVLAGVERNLARSGLGEEHWAKAEDYLYRFYRELKDRIA